MLFLLFFFRKYHRTAIARTASPVPPQCLKREDQVTVIIIIHYAIPCHAMLMSCCPVQFKSLTFMYHYACHVVCSTESDLCYVVVYSGVLFFEIIAPPKSNFFCSHHMHIPWHTNIILWLSLIYSSTYPTVHLFSHFMRWIIQAPL